MAGEAVREAYRLIGERTPLSCDCGALCGAACCAPDADGQGGVYLFPGEDGWLPAAADDFGPLFVCDGTCERGERPLGCRIFPLTPVLAGGGWTVRIDRRARAMCPLASSGLRALDPDFVRAVRRAVRHLAGVPDGEAFLRRWQALEDAFRDARL